MYKSCNNRPRSSRTTRTAGTIRLTDLMRIQNEIIPQVREEKNRLDYDKYKLQESNMHCSKFSQKGVHTIKDLKYYDSKIEQKFIDEELRKRKIDEIEENFHAMQKKKINDKAKKLKFEDNDDIKEFKTAMHLADCLNEREYQKDIQADKQRINDIIEVKNYAQEIMNMKEYDEKELQRKHLEDMKKEENKNMIRDQVAQMKIKKIKEHQEKRVEGFLMKRQLREDNEKHLEELEKLRQKKEKEKKDFINNIEEMKEKKRLQKVKEREEERRINEFNVQKDIFEKVKKDKAKELFDRNQKARQNMIDKQIENLNKIRAKQNQILEKQIKEDANKKEKEEKLKQEKRNKLYKEMEEDRRNQRQAKENALKQKKKEEFEFMDDWHKRMQKLENDEKNERQNIRKKNVELKQYQKMQIEDKANIENYYKDKDKDICDATKQMLQNEKDDYMRYVMAWVEKYKQEGKDIRPLIIQINKWRRRNHMNEINVISKNAYEDLPA